jgi:hypothetical protein
VQEVNNMISKNYFFFKLSTFAFIVSVAALAVESSLVFALSTVAVTAESTLAAAESTELLAVSAALLQATNTVAITRIANNFFISRCFVY